MGSYIIGITGASGTIYAKKLIERMLGLEQQVSVCLSETALQVARGELGWRLEPDMDEEGLSDALHRIFPQARELLKVYHRDHMDAAIASGSFRTAGMVVLPCSMGTLSTIACGASNNLLERAADVMLKERRPLILVPREAPLNPIHLKNMYGLSQMGGIIMPASPSFYHNPKTLDELLDFFIGRLLDQLGLDDLAVRWGDGGCRL
jgi:4-hydroxy-3-polyprenylbenzoate decarboxylase